MLVITNSGENFVITVMLKIFYLKRSAYMSYCTANWGRLFVVEKKNSNLLYDYLCKIDAIFEKL